MLYRLFFSYLKNSTLHFQKILKYTSLKAKLSKSSSIKAGNYIAVN